MAPFVRDRLTWLVSLQLAVYGYALYGLGPSIRLLRDEQEISKTLSGLHGTAMAVGAVAVGLIGPRVVHRVGRRAALWGGMALACVGLAVFSATTLLPVTLLGAAITTFGGSFVVSVTSSVLVDHHRGVGASAALSEGHAWATAVGLLAPLAIGLAVAIGVGWRSGLLAAVVMTVVLALAFGGVAVPDHRRASDHDSVRTGSLPRRYWWAWLALVFCVSVEFSMTIWTSDVLRERVGLTEGAAAAGVSAIVAGMAAGRIVGGRWSAGRDLDRVFVASLAVAAAGFLMFWISTSVGIAIVGLVVCGVGIALHFPIGLMRAVKTAGAMTDLATSRTSLAVGLAVGIGPFVLGAIADAVGTHRAMLVVLAFLVLAAGCVPAGTRVPRPA